MTNLTGSSTTTSYSMRRWRMAFVTSKEPKRHHRSIKVDLLFFLIGVNRQDYSTVYIQRRVALNIYVTSSVITCIKGCRWWHIMPPTKNIFIYIIIFYNNIHWAILLLVSLYNIYFMLVVYVGSNSPFP